MIIPEQYEWDKTPILSYQFITALIKDVFGTYIIDEKVWKSDEDYSPFSRTLFRNRKKYEAAINGRTEVCIQLLYARALNGQTSFDPTTIAQRFTQSVKKNFKINVDFLLFFEDDFDSLRKAKIQMIYHLVRLLLEQIKDKESIPMWLLDSWRDDGPINKLYYYLISMAEHTYTEQVLNNLHLTDPK